MKKSQKRNKEKHVPKRTCVACRKKAPKRDMIRIVLRKDSKEPEVDCGGRISGRGANVCADIKCFNSAIQHGQFERALKKNTGKAKLEELKGDFEKCLKEREFRGGEKKVVLRINAKDAAKKIGTEIIRKTQK